ncbi:unnamed protein product [Brassica rapa]|uniref:Uncharacterized protein n=1 Tax=Brassica campestris TaxID=3711 RepID=A0A8D9G756_BRACM|nr:unnamed protein product [Brassica rapa]
MHSNRRPVCASGHPQMSCVYTKDSPRGPKSPKQSTRRASVLSPRTNVLICVLMDHHGRHLRMSCVCWWTPTDVLCVLTRQPTGAKIIRTVHGKGQRAESKDQRADMCIDGQPRTSSTHTDILCVLTDTHRRPVCAEGHTRTSCPRTSCVCWRTPTDVLCVLNRQPTWTKLTQTIHRKGQRAESKDQRADMCTDGQPRTSCVPRGPKSPKQSTGRVIVPNVLCVLTDPHGHTRTHTDIHGHQRTSCVCCRTATDRNGRPVCAGGHLRTSSVQPTWTKITQTIHRKGQHAESKDQRADMCTDGQPWTSCVC